MSALSDADMAAIRADIAQLLPDTCNILSVSQTPDGQGGVNQTWGTASAAVACRLDPSRGRDQLIGGAVRPFYGFILTVPYDTTLTTAQRIEANSETFAVVSVDAGKSWAGSKRALLERE